MSADFAITAPVLVPLSAGIVLLAFRRRTTIQRAGLLVATGINLLLAMVLFAEVYQAGHPLKAVFGGWQPPVGIGFYADLLASIMVLVSALIAFCGAWYGCGEIGRTVWRRHYGFFFLLLVTGINGAFLTSDLFNMFVWFEVMLMASFALMILGRRRGTYAGTIQYVVINMTASFLFLAGLGILYGMTGTLNLLDLSARLADHDFEPIILTAAVLLLAAYGIKAGVFPLYFWLPASYPHTGFTTSAVFGGLLTKVGVYAIFRVFGGTLAIYADFTGPLLLATGGLTMIAGVLGAASQSHTRRILSFHIVSQIGYIVLGLGLFTQGAIAAAIFYTFHHIIVKTNLFFAAGLMAVTARSERLESLGGLFRARPMLAVLFAIPALSLGGVPPLSGFFAKLLLIRETFRAEAYLSGAIALIVGLVTLFSMSKIWNEVFWKDSPRSGGPEAMPAGRMAPMALMAVLTILIGLFAGPLSEIAEQASAQLMMQQQPPGSHALDRTP